MSELSEIVENLQEPISADEMLKSRSFERVPVVCPETGEVLRYRKKVVTIDRPDGMTKQSDKSRTCIKRLLVARARGAVDIYNSKKPLSGDLPAVDSYFDAVRLVTDTQASFDELPSNTRQFFKNSPLEMVKFLEKPENKEKAIELGLINPPSPAPDPVQVQVVNTESENPPAE